MSITRHPFHILLLIMLPVLCVPRGMLLDYCFCQGVEAGCCGEPEIDTCCSSQAEDEDAGPNVVSAEDCACCETIEVEDFEDSTLRSSDGKVNAVALALATPRPDRVMWTSKGTRISPRAPPQVTPPGLRPGALPLRL